MANDSERGEKLLQERMDGGWMGEVEGRERDKSGARGKGLSRTVQGSRRRNGRGLKYSGRERQGEWPSQEFPVINPTNEFTRKEWHER